MLAVDGNSSVWKELSQPSLVAITENAFSSLQKFDGGLTTNTIVLKSTTKASSIEYKTTSSSTLKGTEGNTMYFPFTVDNDSNRCLVTTIAMNSSGVTITPTWKVGSVTQAFTMLGRAALTQTSIWYLVAPTVGSGVVSISLSASQYWEAGVSLFTGVNQSTPMDKFITVTKPSLNGTSQGQSYIASHAYSGIVNETIIAVISSYSNLTDPQTPSIDTAYSTQTLLWNSNSDGGHRGVAFFQPSSSSTDISALYPGLITSADPTWVIGSLKPATYVPDASGTLRLNGTAAGNTYTQLRSSAQPSSNMTYTLPATPPTTGQVLSSDSSGTMSWITAGIGSSTYTKTCNFVGPISVQNGTARWYPDQSVNITGVYINASTAPTSGPFSIAVEKNGSTIATTSLSAGSYASSVSAINISYTSSDYVTIDVTAANGAADVSVILLYTRV